MAEKKGIKVMANNRKAFHDYFVEDRYEAGIELRGTEVKSVRAGTLNLMVANTYGGPTRVEQGVLRAYHANAIPAGSELQVAGGTLDAGGYEKAFGAISASSGTLVNVAGTCASFEKTGR